jgi:hypothetical protein
MWCDTFDADLLAVVPGAAEALGGAAETEMLTYSRLTDGRINCPSAWNDYGGLTAFFWTDPQYRPAGCWVTDEPVVSCTFLEAVRDEWVHSCAVVVNSRPAWRPPGRLMERLMYDIRGWTVLADDEREKIRSSVLAGLEAAAERFHSLLSLPEGSRP